MYINMLLTNNKIKFNYTRFIANANDLCAYQIEDNLSKQHGHENLQKKISVKIHELYMYCFDQQFIN